MWWTIFTAVDLYVGLIVLGAMKSSISPEKLPRLRIARNALIGLIVISVAVLLRQIARRYGWSGR